jgi:hypothetical protein
MWNIFTLIFLLFIILSYRDFFFRISGLTHWETDPFLMIFQTTCTMPLFQELLSRWTVTSFILDDVISQNSVPLPYLDVTLLSTPTAQRFSHGMLCILLQIWGQNGCVKKAFGFLLKYKGVLYYNFVQYWPIYCAMFGHWWTPICNLLDYRWHRSVCYTRLFTTPLVVITISLSQWVLTLWYLVSERSFFLFSVLSSMSVCPECWQLTDWLDYSLTPVFSVC